MARCALFLTDLFVASGTTLVNHSGQNLSLPASNVSTALPGQVYEQFEGQHPFGGSFEVSTKTGVGVYFNEGAGPLSGVVATGVYTADGLAAAIHAAMNAAGTNAYVVAYNPANRKFTIVVTGSPTKLLNTNPNNVLTAECGFNSIDSPAFVTSFASDNARSSTITRVIFNAGSGNTLAPDFVWTMLHSTGGADTAAATLYNDVTMYAHTTWLGPTWEAWDSNASETIDLSDRPSETENTIQGKPTTGTGYQYWAFFWRHVDDHTSHRIGVLRGAEALTSATRTVREIGDHQFANRTTPRSLENQHPVQLLGDWRMAVQMERWEASEYRAFKVEADRYGMADGVVFALNWTDIVAATLTVDGEADKGLIFYGAITDSSTDGYAGAGSDYMTGSLGFRQLRGPGAS